MGCDRWDEVGGGLGIGWGEMRLVQGGQVRVSGVVRMVGVGVWVG